MAVIWLVDDSNLEREIARRVLSPTHEVVEFDNGEAVLERISQGALPDVLVIDYHLPSLSGIEVTRHLRQRVGPSDLPVLVLSSTHTASDDVVQGFEAGANDYVVKPFAGRELVARVEALAQAKKQRYRAEMAERSLRRLLQSLPDPFIAVDLDGRISFVNREAERILGQDWSMLLTQELRQIIPALGDVNRMAVPTPGLEVTVGSRRYEPAFGRLVIEEQLGETVTITLRDITERQLAIDRRDRVLAMLGHELRNPLAPILSAAQLLKERGNETGIAERTGGIIQRQVERLVRIVDDLLDVSRVSRGRIEIRPEPVDVAVAIERALESSQPLLDARRHRIDWTRPATPLYALADPVRFEQMLTNLLTNAAKYSGEEGRIVVQAYVDGETVVVSVKDNGIGIAVDMLDSIFELFVQIDDSLSRSEGGLGIGLPLVRQLAQMHGGTVTAVSPGPGRGSEFILRLPAAQASRILETPISAVARKPARTETPARAAKPAAAPAPSGGRPATATASKVKPRRVMLVDDNQDVVELIAHALTVRGHDVRSCYDGLEAVKVAQEFQPEVAFLDIGLPGIDGYEVARRLRALGRGMLLVAITGYGQPEDQTRAMDAGFDEHVIKPVSLTTVEEFLAREPA
jgi:signal transduction histidine kinase